MILLLPLLSILSVAAPALAPPASEPSPPPVLPRAARGATGGEFLERASRDLARLRRALTEVLSRVEDARHERDLVKLLCLDEKVSQIKVLLVVGERAETALTEAVIGRDDGALIEISKIAIARAKVGALRADAAACIGQLAYEVGGKTEVYVEEPEDLPDASESAPIVRPEPGADPYRTVFGIPSAAR
jgi:hypothetical protein